MNFSVNELLQDLETKHTYRILWIDEGNVIAYLIDVQDEKAFPFIRKVSDLNEEVIYDQLLKLKNDPFIPKGQTELNEKNLNIRDTAWKIIKDMINNEPEIYYKEKRGSMIQSVIKEFKTTKPTVYKYLRRYWQRGKTPNALLPDYDKSGGKGKEKAVGEKKRGRPRKTKTVGINVDDQTKKVFRVALEKYYLTSQKNSIPAAYKMMVKEFFAEDYYFEDGVKKMIIPNKDSLPSEDQFRYWYNKEYTVQESTIARVGRKKYEKDYREILGSSMTEVIGPGSRYQIDATIADVYLVSRYNRNWIVGRPVIYLVIDVFSRLITGMYIGLEGPSWKGAMMALANVVKDKQAFCKEYEINIPKEAWPCEHLPDVLLADRGEFEGFNVERLITAFNLHVENTAPYRADWKGIVEKQFNTIQTKVKPLLPGYVDIDFRERGSHDYRLDAKLNIYEFTQLMIKQVYYYNTKHYLKDYPRDEDLVRDEVQPIPLELWNWGIQNRSGKLRYFPEDLVKLHLMPQSQASVTHQGIKFNSKMFYSCEKALKESWFPTARQKGSWKTNIAYDPRNMSQIYLLNSDGRSFEICHLLEHQKRYKDKSLDEVNYLLEYEKQMHKEAGHSQLQKDIDFISEAEEIVKSAKAKANEQQNKHLSKAERTGSIHKNRKQERDIRREDEAFVLGKTESDSKLAEVVPMNTTEDDEQKYERPSIKEFLRRRKGAEKR